MIFMEEFQLSKFTNEGAKLLRDVTDEFHRLGLDASNLPKNFPDDSGKIKLVFVGQYSAGKSSLIKMLTGEDLEIGAAITTQDSKSYNWRGLEIIDTPGIHTEIRPDHDEITYYQINHAALLIFVITNAGFSQRMGEHFRTLAIKQHRADNMVLVVNKMDCTALGNVPEQQQIIYEDLKKVTEPYDPKNLYLSFTDTASYFKSLKENDERRKNRRLEQSGHDAFVENLNRFVAEKGFLQKINLPLNIIVAEIKNAASGLFLSDKDKDDFRAYKETIIHKKKIIYDGKEECLADINAILENFKAKVSTLGRDTAESIVSKEGEKDAKTELDGAKTKADEYVKECGQKISEHIKKFVEETTLALQTYENSTFIHQVNKNISHKFNVEGTSRFVQGETDDSLYQGAQFEKNENINGKFNTKGSSEIVQGGATALGAGGAAAGAFAFQYGGQIAAQFAEVAVTPLGNAVGFFTKLGFSGFLTSQGVPQSISGLIGQGAGNLITKISIFREKPTLVNKIAEKFTGNGSKYLGGALAVGSAILSAYMLHRNGKKAEEAENKLHQARKDIIKNFTDFADKVEQIFLNGENVSDEKGVNKFIKKTVDPFIAKLDKEINDVDSLISDEKSKGKKLAVLLKRTEQLIGKIQIS